MGAAVPAATWASFSRTSVSASGSSTGRPTSPADVEAMASGGVPVAVGSGVTPENVPALAAADALIVGSWLKEEGDWRRPVDVARVGELRAALDRLRPMS